MIWRPTADRMPAFVRTVEFWSQMGEVRFFDSGHTPFNRAASRNLAVREAKRLGHCKLVLTDADTIPQHTAVQDAFAAVDDSAVRLPYNLCRVLNKDDRPIGEFGFTCGGVYVTTHDGWFGIGGQDERFFSWSPEDMAFWIAHKTLLGEMPRHDGVLLSLAHDRDPHHHAESDDDPQVALYRQYEAANGDPDRMRELCFPS